MSQAGFIKITKPLNIWPEEAVLEIHSHGCIGTENMLKVLCYAQKNVVMLVLPCLLFYDLA